MGPRPSLGCGVSPAAGLSPRLHSPQASPARGTRCYSEGEKRPQQRAEGYGVLTAVVTGEVSLNKPRIRG